MLKDIEKMSTQVQKQVYELKRQTFNYLIQFLTPAQLYIFNQGYKEGPSESQMNTALKQIERTLIDNAKSAERLEEVKGEYKAERERTMEMIGNLTGENTKSAKEIDELKREIEELKIKLQGVPEEDQDVSERLAKLDALEAGGVENWEWYEEAMQSLWED